MNIQHRRTLAAAVMLSVAIGASAQETRYWSVQGGLNNLSRWPARVDFGGPAVDGALDLRRGGQFGAVWGKQYDKARYELEYQHGRFGIDSVTLAEQTEAVSASGKYDVLTVNVLRSAALNPDLSVYAGLGVGLGRVSLPRIGLATGCNCIGAASKSAFTYLLRTGAEYRVGQSGAAFLQLSWMKLPGADSGAMPSVTYPRRGVAVLGIGYRGTFD